MEQILMEIASKDGLFAVMFVALFVYQIADSRKREERLMTFIEEISKQFESLTNQYEHLADDVREIKMDIRGRIQK
jgi:uncharacterized protein YoxC